MITKLYREPHVLYQNADDGGFHVPEQAIAASVDSGGLIILEQGEDTIIVNRSSVPELCKLLRTLATFARKGEGE